MILDEWFISFISRISFNSNIQNLKNLKIGTLTLELLLKIKPQSY